ncbi:MAG: hypothetical protein ACOY90_02885 [Candidatus Zhuqueibacterota bacterium]
MSSNFNGISEAILGQLSELSIEIFRETSRPSPEDNVSNTIYEITKGFTNTKGKAKTRSNK